MFQCHYYGWYYVGLSLLSVQFIVCHSCHCTVGICVDAPDFFQEISGTRELEIRFTKLPQWMIDRRTHPHNHDAIVESCHVIHSIPRSLLHTDELLSPRRSASLGSSIPM